MKKKKPKVTDEHMRARRADGRDAGRKAGAFKAPGKPAIPN
jgi:hypothetical protein